MRLRPDVNEIFQNALRAVDPGDLVRKNVSLKSGHLIICDREIDLEQVNRIVVVSAGKGAAPMAKSVEAILGGHLSGGIVMVNYGAGLPLEKIDLIEAGHPLPDQAGLEGTGRILEILSKLGQNDVAIILITGGGSSLLEMPVPGITLEDLQSATHELLKCGANIAEINSIRKHLSLVKGGQLLKAAAPAKVFSLAVSDVIGDDPASIASGPTVPDDTTFDDAWRVISKYRLDQKLPLSVVRYIQLGRIGENPETPKPGDPLFEDSGYEIIGNNRIMLEAAKGSAEALGYDVIILTDRLQGEAADKGRMLAALIKGLKAARGPSNRPLCLLAGGETTVAVESEGKGGRNQELALAASIELADVDGCLLLSAGSDGRDGPTDAAGAVVDGTTVSRALQKDMNAEVCLKHHDSYAFFATLGDHVKTGPTRTNVMDLVVMLIESSHDSSS